MPQAKTGRENEGKKEKEKKKGEKKEDETGDGEGRKGTCIITTIFTTLMMASLK